jgi:hypothetical protein
MLLIRNSDISNGLGVDLSDFQCAEVDMFLKVKSNIPLELFTSLFNPILQRKDMDKNIRVLQAITNI